MVTEQSPESLVELWEHLSPENRALVAKFLAFVEQLEAESEEELLMSDPALAASIHEVNDKCDQRQIEEFKSLGEAFPEDV